MARVTRLDGMVCSVARTLDVIGEWWTILILRDAMFGVRRFEDFHTRLGIARTVLSARLERMVEHGILTRHQYSEHPPRSEYLLTEKGRDLYRVVLAMLAWGDTWTADADGPPLELLHVPCGHPAAPEYVCGHCGEIIEPGSVLPRPLLPGALGPMQAP
jgi:DNA-binding HxlR family transcriptional regulator